MEADAHRATSRACRRRQDEGSQVLTACRDNSKSVEFGSKRFNRSDNTLVTPRRTTNNRNNHYNSKT